jgi:hypothetical protein
MSKTATVKLKTEGVKELTSELNKAAKAVDNLEESLEETSGAVEEVVAAEVVMAKGLDDISGGAITAFKAATKGAKTFVLGLKTVKGAMIATGIGALVVLVASLVAYFTQTKKGAEVLEVATAALGVVMGKLTDTLSSLGEIIVGIFTDPVQVIKDLGGTIGKVFSDPVQSIKDFATTIKTYVLDNVQKMMGGFGLLASSVKKLFARDFAGAMEDAKAGALSLADGFIHLNPITAGAAIALDNLIPILKDVISETGDLLAIQNALSRRSIDLRKSIRDTNEAFSDQRKEIADLNKQGDDTSLSIEKRIEATEKAAAKEQALMDQRVANAQEAIDIQIAQMELTKNTEEDEIRISELRVAFSDIQTESLGMQTSLLTKVNGLYLEQEATAKEIADAELLRIATLKAAVQSEQQNEIDAVALKYATLNEMAMGNAETERLLKEKQDAELLAITKKYAEKEADVVATVEKTKQEKRQETIDAVVAMTQAAFSLFAALDQGRENESKKTAKARFKRAKSMQIAGAVMSTGSAIIGALSPPPVGLGPTPAGFAASITAALTGAASIATISKTRFDSGGTPDTPSAPTAGGNQTTALVPDTFAPSTTAPTDLESLTNKPIKAYVVGQDMTSQQELDANLLHHATL